jgi:hypothetical protein
MIRHLTARVSIFAMQKVGIAPRTARQVPSSPEDTRTPAHTALEARSGRARDAPARVGVVSREVRFPASSTTADRSPARSDERASRARRRAAIRRPRPWAVRRRRWGEEFNTSARFDVEVAGFGFALEPLGTRLPFALVRLRKPCHLVL